MATMYFPAIVEGGRKRGYSVYFPDLPGLASAGDTIQDAALRSEEALKLHVAGLLEDGIPVPKPSNLDRIPKDSDVKEIARILVRAELADETAVHVDVTLPQSLVRRIDAKAQNRSQFLADAAERALAAAAGPRRRAQG